MRVTPAHVSAFAHTFGSDDVEKSGQRGNQAEVGPQSVVDRVKGVLATDDSRAWTVCSGLVPAPVRCVHEQPCSSSNTQRGPMNDCVGTSHLRGESGPSHVMLGTCSPIRRPALCLPLAGMDASRSSLCRFAARTSSRWHSPGR